MHGSDAAQRQAAAEAEEADTATAAPAPQSEEQRHREGVAKQGAASMLFLEMLFWKPPGLAAEIRDEYNWRVGAQHCSQQPVPGQRLAGAAGRCRADRHGRAHQCSMWTADAALLRCCCALQAARRLARPDKRCQCLHTELLMHAALLDSDGLLLTRLHAAVIDLLPCSTSPKQDVQPPSWPPFLCLQMPYTSPDMGWGAPAARV